MSSELIVKDLYPEVKHHEMTPQETVNALDEDIVGQDAAKRAVAIALRNRWRRMKLDNPLRDEVMPKNILMIGPTGVGKTEIARRLAKLVNAPFIKVEATKFTEVGYVGRDVDSIIRDLVDVAIKMLRQEAIAKVADRAMESAEERVLNVLLPPPRANYRDEVSENQIKEESATRQIFRKKLRAGELDDKEIEIEVSASPFGVEIVAPPGMEEMSSQLQSMFQSMAADRTKTRKMRVKDALKQAREEEAIKLVDNEEIKTRALHAVEQNGIVFLDEVDKIAERDSGRGPGVSREGVQRDLLPLVEGSTISTKHGMVKTDHILFIASGAFHVAKPSDLIPELQGRLPIRVELTSLKVEDFVRILTEPNASLTKQYTALMATEEVNLQFTEEGIHRIAEVAWKVNESLENIGARRLHTVMERLLETLSFEATDRKGETIVIDKEYVDKYLVSLVKNEDLSRYIL